MFWLTRTGIVSSGLSSEACEDFSCLIISSQFLSRENVLLSGSNWWSWQTLSSDSDCDEITSGSSALEFLNESLLFSSSWFRHLSESLILLMTTTSSCSGAIRWYEKVVLVLNKTLTENESSSILLSLLLMTRSIWYSHCCSELSIDNNSLPFQLSNTSTNSDHMIFWLIEFHTQWFVTSDW